MRYLEINRSDGQAVIFIMLFIAFSDFHKKKVKYTFFKVKKWNTLKRGS